MTRTPKLFSWARYQLFPWAKPAIPMIAGLIVLAGLWLLMEESARQKSWFWLASFAMQSFGLSLSCGALILSAIESEVSGPWNVLRAWLCDFPSPFKGKTQYVGTIGGDFSGMGGVGIGSAPAGLNLTTEEKLELLFSRVDALHKETNIEIHNLKEQARRFERQMSQVSTDMAQAHQRLEEQIKGISAANFYQVLAGLLLLSIGSILSLFIPSA